VVVNRIPRTRIYILHRRMLYAHRSCTILSSVYHSADGSHLLFDGNKKHTQTRWLLCVHALWRKCRHCHYKCGSRGIRRWIMDDIISTIGVFVSFAAKKTWKKKKKNMKNKRKITLRFSRTITTTRVCVCVYTRWKRLRVICVGKYSACIVYTYKVYNV